jgi:hypothetical protein
MPPGHFTLDTEFLELNRIGGWLGPRAGLGAVDKRTVFCLQGRKLISRDGNKNETKLRYRYSL